MVIIIMDVCRKPTVRIYPRNELSYSLTIKDGVVFLAPADGDDINQHWFKEESCGEDGIKDKEGSDCFALVNKATGQALQHSCGTSGHQVQLTPFCGLVGDASILWSKKKDYFGDGFCFIRMANNMGMGFSAVHEIDSDGISLRVDNFVNQENQKWNFTLYDYSGSVLATRPRVRVYIKAMEGYCLTLKGHRVIITSSCNNDDFQFWVKDDKYSGCVKDGKGFSGFSLVNYATGQAISHGHGPYHNVSLVPYNPNVVNKSVMWTESKDLGSGYKNIRAVDDINMVLDACGGNVTDGTRVILYHSNGGNNQQWKLSESEGECDGPRAGVLTAKTTPHHAGEACTPRSDGTPSGEDVFSEVESESRGSSSFDSESSSTTSTCSE